MTRFDAGMMAAPVLLLTAAQETDDLQRVLQSRLTLTVVDDAERARALAATGGFVVVLSAESGQLPTALVVDPSKPDMIAEIVAKEVERNHALGQDDPIAALPYNEYLELARYAATRRYLIALLHRHRGIVTDAARGADLKRESLHRLLRRHHLLADWFRGE